MKMQMVLFLIFTIICESWAEPKPMESIENYNVMIVHGAYGSDKGISENTDYVSAYEDTAFLGNATLGSYTSDNRITKWISKKILEEDVSEKNYENARNSYVYNWRSFTNPANTSLNNAREMGDRTWNVLTNGSSKFGKRRSLFDEAQEIKASLKVLKNGKDSLYVGQVALDTIRKNPDLYRKLASRYILVGHSMGGVVSREYVQGNFYNDDVDKVIMLDSPHEGIGAFAVLNPNGEGSCKVLL